MAQTLPNHHQQSDTATPTHHIRISPAPVSATDELGLLCPLYTANVSIVGQTAIAHQGPKGNAYPADPNGADYLYTHTYIIPLNGSHSSTALMRFPLSHMHINMSQSTHLYQYYTTAGQWRNWTIDPAIVPSDAHDYFDGTQIGTIRYSRHNSQWLNLSPSPHSYLGGGAVWSGSRHLVDDWTPLADLYLMPEVNHTSPSFNDQAWCYTTLEHVEWEVAGQLTFTYVCNGHTFDSVLKNDSLYTPQLVRMPYPTILNKTVMAGGTAGAVKRGDSVTVIE